MRYIFIFVMVLFGLTIGTGLKQQDEITTLKQKLDNTEKALISCLNKSGGFKIGEEVFICEATKVGEDTKDI